jgi:hypothetical protein
MSNKFSFSIFFSLFISISLLGQINTDLINSELQNKISSTWIVKIDTTDSDSLVCPSLLSSGTFKGTITLEHKSSDKIVFFLFHSQKDSVFTYEIGTYHNHASISSGKPRKYVANSYYYKIENYYLFLPMYSSMVSAYPKKSQKQILKLYGKTKKRRGTIREWLKYR